MGRLGCGFGFGLARRRGNVAPPPPSLNALSLSNDSIAESAAAGALVGAVQGLTAGSVLTLTGDAGGRFALSGSDLVRGATALDAETATSHDIELTETNAGTLNSPRVTALTINVTNVLEVTLADLGGIFTLAESAGAGAPAGTITGRASGGTIELLDDAGGRVELSGSDILRGPTALDFETAASHDFTIRETHPDGSNSPHDTVLTLTVTDVDEGGGGGTDPDAPVLTLTSEPGDNPPRWSAVYSGLILGRDTVRLNWRVDTGTGFGAWNAEDHLVTGDDLVAGSWDWPGLMAAAPFAEAAVIEVREALVRDAGEVGEAISAWSNVLSDVIEDATPGAFGFTDQTDVPTNTVITSDAITVLDIDPGVVAPASLDTGEYELNASGVWLAAGDFTVQLNDQVRVRHTSSAIGSTATNQTLTINGVSDTFTSTTAGSTAAFTPSPVQPTDVSGVGSATFSGVEFEDGIAIVIVGQNTGDTQVPLAVQFDGASMGAPIATAGVVGTNGLLTMYALPCAAGMHDIFVDRTATGTVRIMTGTLKNSDGVPVDTAELPMATHTSPHSATSQLDINPNGIGVVMLVKPAAQEWGDILAGGTVVATSPDGNRRLVTMTASGTPGFTTASSGLSGIIAAAFDYQP